MRRGYGYPARGYRSNYQYNQPNIQDYESFFNPVPIDFLQEQLGKRQDRYDTALAGTLGTKDELSQVQVGMADLADKNEIIQEGIGNIQKIVDDKYGGDWGRASKEIARNVTQIRSNPFWNAQKEVEKRREEARQLKIKYGPNAFIFNDPSNISTLDEEGKIRDLSVFEPDIVEKGDWAKTALQLVSSVTPNTRPVGLSKAGFDLLKSGRITELNEGDIEAIANDKNIQNLLRSTHQEFDKAFDKFPEERKQNIFFGAKSKEDAAANIIRGALGAAKTKQETYSYTEDPSIDNERLRQNKTGFVGKVFSNSLSNRSEVLDLGNIEEKTAKRVLERFVDESGNFKNINMNMESFASEKEAASLLKEFPNLYALRDLAKNIRLNNKDVSGMSDTELIDAYYEDRSRFNITMDELFPLQSKDVNDGLNQRLTSHISSGGEFLLEGDPANVISMKEVAKATNMDMHVLRDYVVNEDVYFGYNKDKASYYIELPVFKDKKTNTKWSEGYEVEDYKKVYFALDDDTKAFSTGLKNVERAILSNKEFEKELPGPVPNSKLVLKYSPKEESKFGLDPQNDKIITSTVYVKDGGDWKVYVDENNISREGKTSLSSLKTYIQNFQEYNLLSNYVPTEND